METKPHREQRRPPRRDVQGRSRTAAGAAPVAIERRVVLATRPADASAVHNSPVPSQIFASKPPSASQMAAAAAPTPLLKEAISIVDRAGSFQSSNLQQALGPDGTDALVIAAVGYAGSGTTSLLETLCTAGSKQNKKAIFRGFEDTSASLVDLFVTKERVAYIDVAPLQLEPKSRHESRHEPRHDSRHGNDRFRAPREREAQSTYLRSLQALAWVCQLADVVLVCTADKHDPAVIEHLRTAIALLPDAAASPSFLFVVPNASPEMFSTLPAVEDELKHLLAQSALAPRLLLSQPPGCPGPAGLVLLPAPHTSAAPQSLLTNWDWPATANMRVVSRERAVQSLRMQLLSIPRKTGVPLDRLSQSPRAYEALSQKFARSSQMDQHH